MVSRCVAIVRVCWPPSRLLQVIVATALLVAGCASSGAASPGAASPASSGPANPGGTITLYTSVTQGTVDAVVAAYRAVHPTVTVNVFRAATGELAARIASEQREGGVKSDVLWLTDPLSIQAYAAQGLLKTWQPDGASAIDPAYRTDTFWGTRFLNIVMIQGTNVAPAPSVWHDLTNAAYQGAVGIPDPGFAGSAFGALGYFDQTAGLGMDFYRALKANGATQVKAPDDVTAGVAEGRFKVGMTLDFSARTAIAKGSPIKLVWPTDGAIALYSPIGVVASSSNSSTAESFVDLVLSDAGQQAIAGTGWQPIRAGHGGPPVGGKQVYPDWKVAFARQKDLLTEYRAIFGG